MKSEENHSLLSGKIDTEVGRKLLEGKTRDCVRLIGAVKGLVCCPRMDLSLTLLELPELVARPGFVWWTFFFFFLQFIHKWLCELFRFVKNFVGINKTLKLIGCFDGFLDDVCLCYRTGLWTLMVVLYFTCSINEHSVFYMQSSLHCSGHSELFIKIWQLFSKKEEIICSVNNVIATCVKDFSFHHWLYHCHSILSYHISKMHQSGGTPI